MILRVLLVASTAAMAGARLTPRKPSAFEERELRKLEQAAAAAPEKKREMSVVELREKPPPCGAAGGLGCTTLRNFDGGLILPSMVVPPGLERGDLLCLKTTADADNGLWAPFHNACYQMEGGECPSDAAVCEWEGPIDCGCTHYKNGAQPREHDQLMCVTHFNLESSPDPVRICETPREGYEEIFGQRTPRCQHPSLACTASGKPAYIPYMFATIIAAAKVGSDEANAQILDMLEQGDDIEAFDEFVTSTSSSGHTALYWASIRGHASTVKLLLEKGANTEVTDAVAVKRTALLSASVNGHDATVKLLLDAGANIEAVDVNGDTSLILASRNGHASTVKLLLDEGAKLEATSLIGAATALTWASRLGKASAVGVLLDAGANIEASFLGKTALEWAQENSHTSVVELLEAAAAAAPP